jgi:hypothetical protein
MALEAIPLQEFEKCFPHWHHWHLSVSCKYTGQSKIAPVLLTEHHDMVYWESGGTAPQILDLDTKLEASCQLHTPATLPPQKETLVPTGWIRSWEGPRAGLNMVEKRKFPAPAGTRTPDYPASSPVLYHWAITVLKYTGITAIKSLQEFHL